MRWWLPVKSGYLLFDKVHNSAYEYSHFIVLVMLLAVAVLVHLHLTESVELVSNICEYNVNFHFCHCCFVLTIIPVWKMVYMTSATL